MTELDPRTRALLMLASQADDPTEGERAGNRQHLARRLVALGVTASALAKAPALSAATLPAKGVVGGSLSKVLLTWFSVGALLGGVVEGAVIVSTGDRAPVVETHSAPAVKPRGEPASGRGVRPGVEIVPPTPLDPDVPKPNSAGDPPILSSREGGTTRGPEPLQEGSAPAESPSGSPAVGVPPPSLAKEPDRLAADLRQALQVLALVQSELVASRADRALAELERYAAAVPDGPMEEERRAMRIVALCQLGQKRGVTEAQRFLAERAGSPLITRVRGACGL